MSERMTKQQIKDLEERARKHIESVPYNVSLRWVFYRLLQDGIYSKKGDYKNKWGAQASKFRHDGTWPPDLLEDTTRKPIYRGLSREWTPGMIVEDICNVDRLTVRCKESHFTRQASCVELWFEARAMIGQFERYTDAITLRPFGGMYSIPAKYQAAVELAELAARFEKPAKILYFGDSDDAGDTIFTASTTGHKGFMKWCNADVEPIWCGLTEAQARDYAVPENPDKPGQFQWEALTDAQAREIISQALQDYIDKDIIEETEQEARWKAEELSEKLRDALGGFENE